MASFQLVTAKDFGIDDAIPPKQVNVQFTKTSSLTTRASRYIPHEEEWRWMLFAGEMRYSFPVGFSEALWWEYLALVRYIFMAATPWNAPRITDVHLCFVIPSEFLFQLGLPNPFTYDLRELSCNPLLSFGSKERMVRWRDEIQQRIVNLEAWIAIAKYRSEVIGRESNWNFPPDAPLPTPYILRPGWRVSEQFEPKLWTFQDVYGIVDGRLSEENMAQLDRIGEMMHIVKQESISPYIPEGRDSSRFFPPINLHGPSLFGPEVRNGLARQANNKETLRFLCEIGDDAQVYPAASSTGNVNNASTSLHGQIPSPMSISSSSSSSNGANSPQYSPHPSPPRVPLTAISNPTPSSPSYSLNKGSNDNAMSSSTSSEGSPSPICHRRQTARRSVPFGKRRTSRLSDHENH